MTWRRQPLPVSPALDISTTQLPPYTPLISPIHHATSYTYIITYTVTPTNSANSIYIHLGPKFPSEKIPPPQTTTKLHTSLTYTCSFILPTLPHPVASPTPFSPSLSYSSILCPIGRERRYRDERAFIESGQFSARAVRLGTSSSAVSLFTYRSP